MSRGFSHISQARLWPRSLHADQDKKVRLRLLRIGFHVEEGFVRSDPRLKRFKNLGSKAAYPLPYRRRVSFYGEHLGFIRVWYRPLGLHGLTLVVSLVLLAK